MTNLNTATRELLKNNSNTVRVMELKNNSVINGFKNGKNDTLSEATYNNIGSKTGHKMMQVMVPADMNEEDMNTLENLNNEFIMEVQKLLDADAQIVADKKAEKEDLAKQKAAKKAAEKKEEVATEATSEVVVEDNINIEI